MQWDGETLQPLNYQTSGKDDPCHLQLDETGQWLAVANYSSGSVTVLPIRPDGSLGEMTSHVQHSGHGPQTQRQEKAHAHSTLFTPDNQGLLVADLGIDAVVRYAFAAATGDLSLQGQTVSRPGAGPRHMAFDRRGRILYVANELDNTVAVYHHAQGVLQAQQTIDTIPPGALANTVAHIQLSPDGERVYVSNRGHDSVAMFVAAAHGQFTRLPCHVAELAPAISPSHPMAVSYSSPTRIVTMWPFCPQAIGQKNREIRLAICPSLRPRVSNLSLES